MLADAHAQPPGIGVVLREDTTQRMVAMLGADELDLAVATIDESPPVGLQTRALYEEDLVLVVARDHPLAGRRRIPPASLPPGPFIFFREGSGLRTATEAILDAAGIEPQVRFETNELSRVRALASPGLGVASRPRKDTEVPSTARAARAAGGLAGGADRPRRRARLGRRLTFVAMRPPSGPQAGHLIPPIGMR